MGNLQVNRLKTILKYAVVVWTTTAFMAFILEEAVQTASFGLWILKDQDTSWYLSTLENITDVVEKTYWIMITFNPFTTPVYLIYIKCEKLKLEAWRARENE